MLAGDAFHRLRSQALVHHLTRIAVIFCIVSLTYSNSFHNAFEFDDFHTIVENPAIRSVRNIPRFFTDATTFSVQPANRTYRPIVSTSLAIDYAIARGYDPFWFHLSTFVWFLGLMLLAISSLCSSAGEESTCAHRWMGCIDMRGLVWSSSRHCGDRKLHHPSAAGNLYCTLGCIAALLTFTRFPGLRWTGLLSSPACLRVAVEAAGGRLPCSAVPLCLLF